MLGAVPGDRPLLGSMLTDISLPLRRTLSVTVFSSRFARNWLRNSLKVRTRLTSTLIITSPASSPAFAAAELLSTLVIRTAGQVLRRSRWRGRPDYQQIGRAHV